MGLGATVGEEVLGVIDKNKLSVSSTKINDFITEELIKEQGKRIQTKQLITSDINNWKC